MTLRAVVVGYGSIGARHARILAQLGLQVSVVSRRQVEVARRYASISEAVSIERPDYVVIASRTAEHREDLAELARTGFAGIVLVEKPLFATAAALPAGRFAKAAVGYNLRFHPALLTLRAHLAGSSVYAMHVYAGQYLPDWRPSQDYRAGYSAEKAGGGVLRDLSHELDYIEWLVGRWIRLAASGGHESDLEIDSDDVFCLLLEAEQCRHVTVSLNYLDRSPRRDIVALTSKGTVRVDLICGTVDLNGNVESFSVQRDDTYIAIHRAMIDGTADDVLCSMDEGNSVMQLIAAAEQAATEGRWISASRPAR